MAPRFTPSAAAAFSPAGRGPNSTTAPEGCRPSERTQDEKLSSSPNGCVRRAAIILLHRVNSMYH